MQLLGSGRGTGKTAKMIHWWLEDPENRIVVYPTQKMREHALRLLRDLKAHDPAIKTVMTLATHMFFGAHAGLRGTRALIGVDNWDLLPWDTKTLLYACHSDRLAVFTVD